MREAPRPTSLEPFLGALVLALAVAAASTFPLAAVARLAYPYEIEWLESETLQHVARGLAGEPLYAAPTAEFAPTIYPPGYAFASTLAARVVGVRFLAPRLVSVLALILAMAVVFRAAGREGSSARGGFLAAMLLAASYVACGTVFDLARLDALWVLLLLAGTAAAARAAAAGPDRGLRAAFTAGILLAAAAATKQPAALFALALGAVLGRESRRAGALLLGAFGAATASIYGALHILTGGWSTTYLVILPLKVPHRASAFLHFVRDDMVGTFGPALGILVVWALTPRARRIGGGIAAVWWAGLAAAVAATAAMHTLEGGFENALLPTVAFAAVVVGAIAGRVLRGGDAGMRLVLLVALGLQFVRLFYSPASLVPAAEDRRLATAFVARLGEFPGDVWVPSHTSYAHFADKPFLVHRDPLLDIAYTGARFFPDDLLAALRDGRFGAVVLDGPFAERRIQEALESGYREAGEIAGPPPPLAGYRTRPTRLWLPRALSR